MNESAKRYDDDQIDLDIEHKLVLRYRKEIDYEYILALIDCYQDEGLSEEEVQTSERLIF